MTQGHKIFYTAFFSAILFCFFTPYAMAQKEDNEPSADEYEDVSHIALGLNYISNNVYLGRKDSVRIPYTSPYFEYRAQSGFFAKTMVSYTTEPKNHIDLLTLQGGFEHSFGDLNTSISADKYFYSKKSSSVRASITGSMGVYASYDNDWVTPMVSADILFGTLNDYIVGTALDHEFSMAHDQLTIRPTITLFAGTQNYYDQYFIGKGQGKKLKKPQVVGSADKLQVMDYELSLPIAYSIHHWLFGITPTYVLPQNPATVTIDRPNGTTNTFTEKLDNSFIMELDIAYRINTKHSNKPMRHGVR